MPSGFIPNLPQYQDACFVLDPNAGLTDGNLWRDSGPHSLDVSPVNFVAPNYGISRTSRGSAYIAFNGTTQRGTLPLRFYDHAPTSALTIVVVAMHTGGAAADRIFRCRNAGDTRGFQLSYSTAERLVTLGRSATGALTCSATESDDSPLTSRTRVSILSWNSVPTAMRWVDCVGRTVAAAGTTDIGYDAATVPTVGADPGGGNEPPMDLYHLSIWPRVFSDREARAFSTWLRDGGGA